MFTNQVSHVTQDRRPDILGAAGKKLPVVIAAIAREMAAFLWAIAREVAPA
jgi:hypothetical protein